MVKFLKLPVLFRRVIYLMNKASPSISLPPPSPYPTLLSRGKHALTARFCTIFCLSCAGVSRQSHSFVQIPLQLLLQAEELLSIRWTTIYTVFHMKHPWVAVPTIQNCRNPGSLAAQALQVPGHVRNQHQPFCALYFGGTRKYSVGRLSLFIREAKAWKRKQRRGNMPSTGSHLHTDLCYCRYLYFLVFCGWELPPGRIVIQWEQIQRHKLLRIRVLRLTDAFDLQATCQQ